MSHRSTCTYASVMHTGFTLYQNSDSSTWFHFREVEDLTGRQIWWVGAGADCVDMARKVQLFIMCPHHSLVCFCWIFSSRDLRMLQCWQSHPLVQVYSVQPHKCNKKEKKTKLLVLLPTWHNIYGLGNCGLFYWKLLGFSQRHSSHRHQWSSACKSSQFETLMLKCKNIRKGNICWVFYFFFFNWQLFDCTL